MHPDLSQVDVDRQVTNLSRFELFFPEKRQFFLENGDLFANYGYATIRPFFSRRIGLGVPIQFGARLSFWHAYNLESRFCNGSTATVDACVSTSGMLGGLRKSIGIGVRWRSPIGPLRLEWGIPLDLKPGEKPSGLDFTIGTSF